MKKKRSAWFLLATVPLISAMLVAGCDGPPPPPETAPPPSSTDISAYRLGSGDQIRLIVFNEPTLSGEFTVDGRGALSLPLIGKVDAQGLTASELEKRIVARLSPEYLRDPSVAVEVITYRPFYIVGEVKNPGSYPYVNGMSVINAVALAGGFTYRARENVFDISRNIKGEPKKFAARPDTEVMPGDVITVRERYF